MILVLYKVVETSFKINRTFFRNIFFKDSGNIIAALAMNKAYVMVYLKIIYT